MKPGEHVADFLTAVFLLAAVYVLVRPRSKGADLVRVLSDAVVALVTTVTTIP